ncbi:putative immunity protein [Kocuria palustris]|uniref:putative immunity protein n=1 Tax=Kocuria palustris TaxID=71999 RepID=UPI002301F2E8|nr:exonuclease SbcC [Kocuria palustris]
MSMTTNSSPIGRVQRTPDFDLSMEDLRAVAAFNLACALQVIDLFEAVKPHDARPRDALVAAENFVRGGPRSRAQRISAPAAHRASRQVIGAASHAAMPAGDAAASAYLHPLADAAQVGHILRGPSHCVLALEMRTIEPLTRATAAAAILERSTPAVVEVLCRYPSAATRDRATAYVMSFLDVQLRKSVRR